MLTPHPATLRRLVEEYESVVAHQGDRGDPQSVRRAQDLAYTLCVSTGTRDVRRALDAARTQLAAAQATTTAELCGTGTTLPGDLGSHGPGGSGYVALHEQ
ncbi:DUF5133 domain-containing protein [Streptomyces sp. 11x1]|uniref:DUF5133 domain-containing protein n=1 Tax=Streptomyces sp. 11x1 TaxID=3038642 RepID=UPI00292E1F0E|nr:DUF5133 domain-containing protein [Streptomyces sp. 11x1]WNZ14119.1 DUF5133 domain-containing protein [Streptomyces sp. 11x1]